jgi:hypothetical protein
LELLHWAVNDAERKNHPVTLAITLIYAISVLFWTGDLDGAKRHVDWFVAHVERHALAPYLAVGRGFTGRLAMLQGDAKGASKARIERASSTSASGLEARFRNSPGGSGGTAGNPPRNGAPAALTFFRRA